METPILLYLTDILDAVRGNDGGAVADYIPELAEAHPDYLAAALCTASGRLYSVGDDDQEFTIQSISKPFVYALALQELGLDAVMKTVGMEPSGEAFNELSLGEEDHRPVNPMINVGAMAVTQLINGPESGVEERIERIRAYMSALAGRELRCDRGVSDSELDHAERNLSLAHMLRSYGIITDEAHDAVLTYTHQCALLVTVKDLAVMSATLANGGRQPVTGEKILDADVCRLTLAVMASAGMYNGAGRWMAEVGIPAKSGVAGGLIGTLPGQLGVATFSPRLNEEGNSVRGVEAFKRFSKDLGLHLMSTADRVGAQAVRSVERREEATVVRVQGYINFTAAESVINAVAHMAADGELAGTVYVDVEHVSGVNRVGRALLNEGLRRLQEGGHEVAFVDPDGTLEDRTARDGEEIPLHTPEGSGDEEDHRIGGEEI